MTGQKSPRKVIIPIGPSIAYVPLTRGQYSLIDSVDAERVGQHNWYADWSKGTQSFYAIRGFWMNIQKKVRLHRFILSTESGLFTDHKNGNTLDNRGSNLRPATHKQNIRNQRMRSGNITGFKGVYMKRNRYMAQIRVDGKLIHLGTYATPEAANEVRKNAAAIHHGEFVRKA